MNLSSIEKTYKKKKDDENRKIANAFSTLIFRLQFLSGVCPCEDQRVELVWVFNKVPQMTVLKTMCFCEKGETILHCCYMGQYNRASGFIS